MDGAELEQLSAAQTIAAEELQRFRGIRQLRNHWARPGGGPAYYWYLTFERCAELQALARRCQEGLAFPYYDFTPAGDLHMTLDRIGFVSDISADQLRATEAAAARACGTLAPFEITIGALGGTPGAIGLSGFPRGPIQRLRDTLRTATLSVRPDAPVKDEVFHPHVAIAYCNADVPAAHAIAAVDRLNPPAPVRITVQQTSLVLLERLPRAYVWRKVAAVPLTGIAPSRMP